jgi:hypothetical protein
MRPAPQAPVAYANTVRIGYARVSGRTQDHQMQLAAIHARLPQRALLDILTRTAYLLGWHRHFGPASGSDPKIRDAMARYVQTVFAHGTLLGPAQVAAHMRGQVSVHELSLAGNKYTTATKIDKASVDVINAFSKLDVAGVWGDGKTAGTGNALLPGGTLPPGSSGGYSLCGVLAQGGKVVPLLPFGEASGIRRLGDR